MDERDDWEIPEAARPKAREVAFDLEAALSSVVSLRSKIPHDAFLAPVLGTERAGYGVLIRDDGLVLTIGYLIAEAESVWLVANSGRTAAAHLVAYDHETGFGLVQALGRLDVPAMELGVSAEARAGDSVIVAGQGGPRHALASRIAAKREFAGYWEYLLDEAIFTVPAHPFWGGAAAVGRDGRLLGIGSLFVSQVGDVHAPFGGNMIVPIDLLKPILDDLLACGRINKPPRPWLGMYTTEADDMLVVAGMVEGGPAERSGIEVGDVIVEVAGTRVSHLASLFRRIWGLGRAGVEVPLTLRRDDEMRELRVRSADRYAFLKAPRLH